MFAITLCIVIIVTVSNCHLEQEQCSSGWDGLFKRPFGLFRGHLDRSLDLSKGSSDFQNPIDYWDWREKGMVTPVKNQLDCNACWAFAIIAAIESHRLIHLKINEILSEQFLIDCMYNKTGSGGCGIASILQTFVEIIFKYGGVLRDVDYRSYSAEQMTCEYPVPVLNPSPVPVYGFRRVDAYNFNEEIMQQHLHADGPLVARINSASMDKYEGGIDEPTKENCDPALNSMNHAILIVGYSSYVSGNRVVPYWIIKNSWGPNWGMEGYYYLVRGKNACGITNDVSIPIVLP